MSDTVKSHPRPLSPHLQVYRLPMTAIMSISHRITGVVLAGGCLLITAFLAAAATSPRYYDFIMGYSNNIYATAFLFLWSFVLYYHLCNGIRHLFWDMVMLIDEKKAIAAGWVVLLASAALTAGTWYLAAEY